MEAKSDVHCVRVVSVFCMVTLCRVTREKPYGGYSCIAWPRLPD